MLPNSPVEQQKLFGLGKLKFSQHPLEIFSLVQTDGCSLIHIAGSHDHVSHCRLIHIAGSCFTLQGHTLSPIAVSCFTLQVHMVLELQSEVVPVYPRLSSFYGQPFIWNMFHIAVSCFTLQGHMVVLDLQSEVAHVYQCLSSFYGQPFIWNMFHIAGPCFTLQCHVSHCRVTWWCWTCSLK